MWKGFVCCSRRSLVLLILFLSVWTLCNHTFAGWNVVADKPLPVNAETTISLRYDKGTEESTSGVLWLVPTDISSVLVPETVQYNGDKVSVPAFFRTANPTLLVHDAERDETTTISLAASPQEGRFSWRPSLSISPAENYPIVLANQEVTPTLTLAGGTGQMPPSAHISAMDHRGRLVMSRFFSTFDLLGGLGKLKFPAIGQYTVSLKLLDDHITSLPQAAQREPIVLPFGTWVERAHPQDVKAADYVTTDVVVGNLVAFEHIPTTATVLSEDKIVVPVFAVHSRESRLNRWPYMISDLGIYSMPVSEQQSKGADLLRWQRALGATFGLIHVNWGHLQTSPGGYRWHKLTDLLPLYRRNQVRPVLALVGRSAWSDSLPYETTETLTAWQDFSFELSEKFRQLIWGLQVWRYPQTESADDVTSYSNLVSATYTGFSTRDGKAIQAAPILAGATHWPDSDFVQALLKSEAREAIGGISFDQYPSRDYKGSPGDNGFEEAFDELKTALKDSGKADLPVWLMNTGWVNGTDGVTQDLQANYLVRTHTLALAQGFHKVGWDGLADKSAVPWAADQTQRMGLLTADLRPKLAGIAYNNMTYLMSGLTPKGETRQGKARVFSFNIGLQSNKWPGLLYVAWTESPQETQEILLPMTQGGGVYALDYLGAEVPTEKVEPDPKSPIAGTYRIPVGFEPVFIWDAGKPGNSQPPPTEAEQE